MCASWFFGGPLLSTNEAKKQLTLLQWTQMLQVIWTYNPVSNPHSMPLHNSLRSWICMSTSTFMVNCCYIFKLTSCFSVPGTHMWCQTKPGCVLFWKTTPVWHFLCHPSEKFCCVMLVDQSGHSWKVQKTQGSCTTKLQVNKSTLFITGVFSLDLSEPESRHRCFPK